MGGGRDSIKNKVQSFGFFALSARTARPARRGGPEGGRGFRLPLPRPSGLPTLPNDQGLNPGPKRGSRSVQRPEKTIVLGPRKLSGHPMANVFFLIGLCPPLRLYHRIPPAAHSGTPSPAGSPPWGSKPEISSNNKTPAPKPWSEGLFLILGFTPGKISRKIDYLQLCIVTQRERGRVCRRLGLIKSG